MEKAWEKLSSARDLLQSQHYEDTISRAYYAVYHAASAVLLTEGVQAKTHKGLVSLFGLLLIKTEKIEKEYGRYLSNLKDDRETCDYELFSSVEKEDAEQAIQEADRFVGRIQTYLKSL